MLSLYLAFDPFEVVFPSRIHFRDPVVPANWDVNAVETLLRNYDTRQYDSFIFGNSRSMAYLCSDWVRHIDSPRTLHMAAAQEGIYGIHAKITFLSRRGIPIRNALLVLDPWTLSLTATTPGLLYIKHPKTTGESLLTFHETFFRSFIEPKFLAGYLDYRATGRVRPCFRELFVEGLTVDRVTGDKRFLGKERAIEETPDLYYKNLAAVFYPRDLVALRYAAPAIGAVQAAYLQEIRKIFDANRTDYRVVINPTYDALKLDPGDLARLREIFGVSRVHDYSGINRFTRDLHNYYENSHFRIRVGREIMDEIYPRP